MTFAKAALLGEPSTSGADLSPTRFRLLLAALFAAAASLGLFRLGTPSVWLDEAVSWFNSSGSWQRVFERAAATDDMGGVVYAPLLKLWLGLAGDSELAMRLPSVAAMIAVVAVMACLGRVLWDRRASVMTGLLTVFHPSVLSSSRQARGYVLILLFSALCLLGLARQWMHGPRRGRLLLAVAGLGVTATHIFGVFVTLGGAAVSALIGWHAVRADPRTGRVPSGARARAAGGAVLPWVPSWLFVLAWGSIEARMVAARLTVFWVPGTLARNTAFVLALMVGPILAGAAAVLSAEAAPRARQLALGLLVVAGPVFLGPLLVSLVSLGHHNFMTVRYAMPLVLPGALGCGFAISRLRWAPASVILTIGAAFSVWNAVSHNVYASAARGGQEIRSGAAFLRSHVQPGEEVVAVPAWEWFSLSYYRVPNVRELPPRGWRGRGGPTWQVVFHPVPDGLREARSPAAPQFGTLRIDHAPPR